MFLHRLKKNSEYFFTTHMMNGALKSRISVVVEAEHPNKIVLTEY